MSDNPGSGGYIDDQSSHSCGREVAGGGRTRRRRARAPAAGGRGRGVRQDERGALPAARGVGRLVLGRGGGRAAARARVRRARRTRPRGAALAGVRPAGDVPGGARPPAGRRGRDAAAATDRCDHRVPAGDPGGALAGERADDGAGPGAVGVVRLIGRADAARRIRTRRRRGRAAGADDRGLAGSGALGRADGRGGCFAVTARTAGPAERSGLGRRGLPDGRGLGRAYSGAAATARRRFAHRAGDDRTRRGAGGRRRYRAGHAGPDRFAGPGRLRPAPPPRRPAARGGRAHAAPAEYCDAASVV